MTALSGVQQPMASSHHHNNRHLYLQFQAMKSLVPLVNFLLENFT